MQTIFVVAEFLVLLRLWLCCRRCLLRGRNINRRNQIISAAVLERWHAFIFVISTTTGTRTWENQVVHDARVAARHCLIFGWEDRLTFNKNICCFAFHSMAIAIDNWLRTVRKQSKTVRNQTKQISAFDSQKVCAWVSRVCVLERSLKLNVRVGPKWL